MAEGSRTPRARPVDASRRRNTWTAADGTPFIPPTLRRSASTISVLDDFSLSDPPDISLFHLPDKLLDSPPKIMAASPVASPRLPSPPPIAEDQIGPTSPGPHSGNADAGSLESQEELNQNAYKRIRPGTKAADIPEGPPLMDLAQIDSPFQLTEHLKALYNAAIHRQNPSTTTPIDRQTAVKLAQPPDGVDKSLWLYELCRFLCQKVNDIINALFSDTPPCSSLTCNEMRASEWQYLCAVHDPPKPCCAIDYCCHTLDWAANVLTSPKQFPSRLTFGADEGEGNHQQLRQLTNIFRRVYRIFAHAWFQHQEAFWKVESNTGLYIFFKTVCDLYGLIPEDSYTIPSDAEGIEAGPVEQTEEKRPTILGNQPGDLERQAMEAAKGGPGPAAANVSIATGHTTKRHRQMPSTGAASVSTVIEEPEDEEKEDNSATLMPDQVRELVEAANAVTLAPAPEAEPETEKFPSIEEPATEPEVSTVAEEVPEAVIDAEITLANEPSEESVTKTIEPVTETAKDTGHGKAHEHIKEETQSEVPTAKTEEIAAEDKPSEAEVTTKDFATEPVDKVTETSEESHPAKVKDEKSTEAAAKS